MLNYEGVNLDDKIDEAEVKALLSPLANPEYDNLEPVLKIFAIISTAYDSENAISTIISSFLTFSHEERIIILQKLNNFFSNGRFQCLGHIPNQDLALQTLDRLNATMNSKRGLLKKRLKHGTPPDIAAISDEIGNLREDIAAVNFPQPSQVQTSEEWNYMIKELDSKKLGILIRFLEEVRDIRLCRHRSKTEVDIATLRELVGIPREFSRVLPPNERDVLKVDLPRGYFDEVALDMSGLEMTVVIDQLKAFHADKFAQ